MMKIGGEAPNAWNAAQSTAMSKAHHARPPSRRGSRALTIWIAPSTPSDTVAAARAALPCRWRRVASRLEGKPPADDGEGGDARHNREKRRAAARQHARPQAEAND